jgi:VWFA-related protein
MRRISTAALVALLALPAFSQQKLVETIEVRVMNIDVVVRDRAGHAITGLTKDDFVLYEDGVPQPITNIYEVRRDEATGAKIMDNGTASDVPDSLRQRRLVLFVDCASLQPARKRLVLASVAKFIDRMQPEDQAMLVAWRLGLKVITPFTNDKAVLKRGMTELEKMGPAGEAQEASIDIMRREIQTLIDFGQRQILPWDEAYTRARTMIDRQAQQVVTHEKLLLDGVDRMVATVGGLEGKKILVLVSAFVPQRPGAELYRYIYDQFAPFMDRNPFAEQIANFDSQRNEMDLQGINGVMGANMPDALEQTARRASTNGVVMYAIDAAEVQSELSAANTTPVEGTESFSRHENTASALKLMADITGGVAVTQMSNYDSAFDTINHDLDSYYSLGYKPKGEGNIAARKIVVKVKDRKVNVRARESIVLKTPDDQMNDRVIANLFSEQLSSAWPITVRLGIPRLQAGRWVVPVQVVMPSTVTLLPQDQVLVGGITFYFATGKADGRTSEVMRRPRELRIPASAESLVRAKPITFTTAIGVNAGESTLSVGVIDQISGTTGYARTKILAR